MTSQALPAGTPAWVSNTCAGLRAGTAVVTATDCTREGHAEQVTVRTMNGRVHTIPSVCVAAMLPEEVQEWQRTS